MRSFAWLVAALCAAAVPSVDAADAAETTPVLETVVVSGAQPGPGLWRVSKDDHEMWILGTLSPLPPKMQWISRDVEATIARSQEVLLGPTAQLDVGVVSGLFLLPSLLAARNNPDDAKLADVVPPALYARWTPLREKYLPRDRAIEKRRPIFAAEELYQKAVERSGLSGSGVVMPVVEKAAKKHRIPTTQPKIRITVDAPRAAVKEFRKASLDDVECFAQTLDRVETDLGPMRARANAWATGDIEALRALPYTDQQETCANAFLGAGAVQGHGFDDIRARLRDAWLAAAEKALATNRTTFAALPIAQILRDDGLVATLREKGYAVEAPE
jgi:hypothetical protein